MEAQALYEAYRQALAAHDLEAPKEWAATTPRAWRVWEDFADAAEELAEADRPSDLAIARRVIRRIGPPPPGDGTHPLQGHRDSMG